MALFSRFANYLINCSILLRGSYYAALCQALEVHWENGTPVDREIRSWVAEAREVVTPETAVYMA